MEYLIDYKYMGKICSVCINDCKNFWDALYRFYDVLGMCEILKIENLTEKVMEHYKWTPIKCSQTKESVCLGDKVKDFNGNSGYLAWDSCFNSYYIKTVDGGKINAQKYIKTTELTKNNIDTTSVECRKNHLKKKW